MNNKRPNYLYSFHSNHDWRSRVCLWRGALQFSLLWLFTGLGLSAQYVWETLEGPPEEIISLASGNGMFVGLGESGLVYTSSDSGENWTAVPPGHGRPTDNKDKIIFDGQRFCLLIDQWMATSTNGLDWIVRPVVAEGLLQLASLEFADADMSLYIAIRTVRTSTEIWTSSDRIHWEKSQTLFGWFDGLAYGNGRFLIATVGGALGSDRRYSSQNGLNFTTLSTDSNRLLGFANGYFYEDSGSLSHSELRYSSDGETWQPATTQVFKGRLISGGVLDFKDQTVIATSQGMLLSADGIFFTVSNAFDPNTGSTSSFNSITANQNAIVLSSENIEALYISDDGQNIRIPSGGSRLTASDPLYRPDLKNFILMPSEGGNSEQIYYLASSAEDLLLIRGIGENTFTWSYVNSPAGFEYSSLQGYKRSHGALYVQSGGNDYFFSSDGLNFIETDRESFNSANSFWSFTLASEQTPSPSRIYSIAIGEGTYVAVGRATSFNDYVWVSTDGVSYEAYSIAEVEDDDPVFFIDGRFVYTNTSQSAFVAENGLSGSQESFYWSATNDFATFEGGSSFAQAGEFLFARKAGESTDRENVNGDYVISKDGIAYEQTFGHVSHNMDFYGLERFQHVFHFGDNYYAMSANGCLMRSPDVSSGLAASQTVQSVLQNLPDKIEFEFGVFDSHSLNVPENTRFVLISELPPGLSLHTTEAIIEGNGTQVLLLEAVMLSVVTDERVYQKELAIEVKPANSGGSWYAQSTEIQPAGWRHFDWFKGFKPKGENWIFHGRHGWLYVQADDTSRMFLWDVAIGRWLFTNETIYPWMYAYGPDEGWVFFFEGGRPGSRFFKRGDNGQVVSEQVLRAD